MSINDLKTTPSQDETATPAAVSPSNEGTATDLQMPDEKTVLLQRAKLMGLNVSNNIGLDTLRKKLEDHQAAQDSAAATASAPEADAALKVNPLAQGEAAPEKPTAKPKTLRQILVEEQMKLVRLRIQNLDDKKKDLPGEVFTVANEYIGTVRKYIPYDETSDEGYHVPWCIYQMLKDRMFLSIRTSKGKNGTPKVDTRWAREFSLEILPPLTEEEIERLAQAQIAAGSLAND
ncbi:hypothetical protein CH29_gp73 [Achromobacter phage JWAlpha]|uniref:Uncharacterized protein n=1 Tax=Achromobacter phage JWAlpha TaxID=1416009 RepID=V9VG35_9CAUD|nr:hypothetical protein CH29_gp73 [Achromobacter phage JWAlpha]AHC94026.1 hypothetical protein JJJB_0073 [Achromobacter phage JWAlpha]